MSLIPGRLYRVAAPYAGLGIFRSRLSPTTTSPGFQLLQVGTGGGLPRLVHAPLTQGRSSPRTQDLRGIEDVPDTLQHEALIRYLCERTRDLFPDREGWFRR